MLRQFAADIKFTGCTCSRYKNSVECGWEKLSFILCFLCSDPVVNERWKARGVLVEAMEIKLGRFLCFLNTLSSTHSTVRAVLAEDRWFTSLVKIVNIDTTTGEQRKKLWNYLILSLSRFTSCCIVEDKATGSASIRDYYE